MNIYLADGPSEESFDDILPSFTLGEIYSPEILAKKMFFTLDALAALKLQRFRDHIHRITGEGLLINHGKLTRRGVRSIADQTAIAGKKAETWSAHVAGKAFDISLTREAGKYTNAYLYNAAKDHGWGAVGRYQTFIHVDNRDLWGGKQITWGENVNGKQ